VVLGSELLPDQLGRELLPAPEHEVPCFDGILVSDSRSITSLLLLYPLLQLSSNRLMPEKLISKPILLYHHWELITILLINIL
jgi:hypothetical protein